MTTWAWIWGVGGGILGFAAAVATAREERRGPSGDPVFAAGAISCAVWLFAPAVVVVAAVAGAVWALGLAATWTDRNLPERANRAELQARIDMLEGELGIQQGDDA